MKPKVCNGVPEIDGKCLDEIINDIALSLHNMDYEKWEERFMFRGGDRHMAEHLWDKWKSTHHDNFLTAYLNMDSNNQRTIIAIALDDVKEREFKKKWNIEKRQKNE